MQRLRSSPLIARWLLAWLLCVMAVAGVRAMVHPQSLMLVCSASGAVMVAAQVGWGEEAEDADREAAPGRAAHALDCPLCVPGAMVPAVVAWQPAAPAHHQTVPWPSLGPAWATLRAGAALPARGPPPRRA